MVSNSREIINGMRLLLDKAYRDECETHELIYITNLLENGLIESYREGKITKEKLDHLLYHIHDASAATDTP